MFSLFKKEKKLKIEYELDFCQTLFADVPLELMGKYSHLGEPWTFFSKVKKEIEEDHYDGAVKMLKKMIDKTGIGSRNYLQTWYFLRKIGIYPDSKEGKKVCGVIVEASVAEGVDRVAVYEDLSAHYLSRMGETFTWERPKTLLDSKIQDIFNFGKQAVIQIEPWEDGNPEAPIEGNIRINVLTPEGIYFVEGPTTVVAIHEKLRPIIDGAYNLMQELTRIHGVSL